MKSSILLRPALASAALLTLALFSTLWFAAADAADSQSVSGIVADIEDDLADDFSFDLDEGEMDSEDKDLDDLGEEPPLLEEGQDEDDASTIPDQMRALFARADAGDAEAQNLIGVCYFYGKRVEKNIKEAVIWFSRSAALGNPKGQTNLALCYLDGSGGKRNEIEARRLLRLAANQGYANAQYELGSLLESYETKTTDKEAAAWLRRAAEQNHPSAQYRLGVCYTTGKGVIKNEETAFGWFRKAADQGQTDAELAMGLCYTFGQGVKVNGAKAVRWLYKAARKGNAEAQFYLGMHYIHGDGVKRSIDEAVRWFRKAAAQGHDGADEELRRLGK